MIMDGVDAVVAFVIATVIAILVTVIGDYGFDQHWNFFIVWLICVVAAFGGFIFLDSDGDLW